jgi:SET domain-containing protein
MPPEDDPACYTNHDPEGFNTSVVFDKDVSDEPIFVANRDIEQGEEITNNYLEFDKNSAIRKFEWLKS